MVEGFATMNAKQLSEIRLAYKSARWIAYGISKWVHH